MSTRTMARALNGRELAKGGHCASLGISPADSKHTNTTDAMLVFNKDTQGQQTKGVSQYSAAGALQDTSHGSLSPPLSPEPRR